MSEPKNQFYYYASTGVANENEENEAPRLRVLLDAEELERLFGSRLRFAKLLEEDGPKPCALTFHTAAEFGSIDDEDAVDDLGERISGGGLVHCPEVEGEHDPEPDPDDEDDCAPRFWMNDDLRSTDYEELCAYGVEYRCVPKYGGNIIASFSWREFEEAVASRSAWFPVSETARLVARGIITDNAPDRIPILLDALEDGGAPKWLTDTLRLNLTEGRGGSKGDVLPVMLYASADNPQSHTILFLSIAGLVRVDSIPAEASHGQTQRAESQPAAAGADPEGAGGGPPGDGGGG